MPLRSPELPKVGVIHKQAYGGVYCTVKMFKRLLEREKLGLEIMVHFLFWKDVALIITFLFNSYLFMFRFYFCVLLDMFQYINISTCPGHIIIFLWLK